MTPPLIPVEGGGYSHPDDPGEPSTGRARVSIADDEVRILAYLAAGRRVLEIGTGLGVSTKALASQAKTVCTVDIDPWVQETIWPDLPETVRARDQVPIGLRFDLVFIDGNHGTDAVRADIAAARAVCVPGGMIVCHDANYGRVAAGLGAETWFKIDTTHGLAVSLV